MIGWIKLHRAMLDWEWYDDLPTFRLFTHLLLVCNHAPDTWKGIHVACGQVITGRQVLAKETGLSEQQVRRALSNLKTTNEITIKTTKVCSIVTITKWDEYQGNQPTKEPTKEPQNNRKTTTTKEDKKERIPPNPQGGFEAFWESYPRQRRGDKDNAARAWNRALTKATEAEIISGVKAYAKSDEVARGFAKGAAAWLNDSRWANQYQPVAQTRGSPML